MDAGVQLFFRHFKLSMCLLGTLIYALSFGWLPLVRVATVRQVVRLYFCMVALLVLDSLLVLVPLWNTVVHALPGRYETVLNSLSVYRWILAMMLGYSLRRTRIVRACDRAVRRWIGFPEPAAQ